MTYIEPLIFFFLVVSAAAAFGLRGSPVRKAALAAGLAGLFLLSWPPAEWLFSRPLEAAYPVQPFKNQPGLQAIVVLGGGISPPEYERPYPRPDMDTFEHCLMASWVYRQTGPLPVLACEGTHNHHSFPAVTRELLLAGGIPDNLIWIEDRSRNTHENATFGSAILRQHGIRRLVLVTDAQSMPRASACFQKEGMMVFPAPTDFGELEFSSDDLLPNWKAIRRNERTLHEILGLAWYRLKGWI
jgi:uncharacterized SAM-binding protein YcdF (DUF218 family)